MVSTPELRFVPPVSGLRTAKDMSSLLVDVKVDRLMDSSSLQGIGLRAAAMIFGRPRR